MDFRVNEISGRIPGPNLPATHPHWASAFFAIKWDLSCWKATRIQRANVYKGLNKALGQVHSKWYIAPSYPQLVWSGYQFPLMESPFTGCPPYVRVSDGQNPDSSPDGDQSLFDLLHISGFLGREGLGHQETSLQPLQNRLKLPRVCVWWKDHLRVSL